MKLWRNIRLRMLVAAIVAGLLGFFIAQFQTARATQNVVRHSLIPHLQSLVAEHIEDCRYSPQTWTMRVNHMRFFAYDANTRLSKNPNAPPLEESLVARFKQGEDSPMQLPYWGVEQGGKLLLHTDVPGCEYVEGVMPPHAQRYGVFLLIGGVIVSALAFLVSMLMVVWPFTRRVDRLQKAATNIGNADTWKPVVDRTGDELAQLASSLDAAHDRIVQDARELAERNKALERHLLEVSHDLKTPIASLSLAIEQAATVTKDENVAEQMRRALRDIVYLRGLTDNLRFACRMREGWSAHEGSPAADFCQVVQSVTLRAQGFAKLRNIALDFVHPEQPVWAACDPIAAEQMLSNLVDNAILYGDENGHIAIVLERADDRFTLTVMDDGPGVPPTDIPRLVERTFRSDYARKREPNGTGLGLTITHEICEQCGFLLQFRQNEPRGLVVAIAGHVAEKPA